MSKPKQIRAFFKSLGNNLIFQLKTIGRKVRNCFKNFNPNALVKPFLGSVALLAVVFFAYVLLKHFGILNELSDIDKLVAIIKGNNKYYIVSILIYILIQMMQVIFLPIPAFVTTSAGFLVFGNLWEPIIYSLAAIIPASLIAFYLGHALGKPFVSWMIGRENMEKYLKKSNGKEKPIFFTMFLLPFFPDDILCLVAGVTTMSFKAFLAIQLICRPPAVIGTVLMVGGLLNFNFLKTWYGVIIIVFLAALFITATVVSIKYATQIESFFTRFFSKFKSKKNRSVPSHLELLKTAEVSTIAPDETDSDVVEDFSKQKTTSFDQSDIK